MKKPASLREALCVAMPALRDDPAKFLVFIDAGAAIATNNGDLSFLYRYTLNLILTDFGGDTDQVFAELIAWIAVNQPELLDNVTTRQNAITFEVDILNSETCDVSIKVELTERVKVTTDQDGVRQFEHIDEVQPEWTYSDLIGANG